MLPGPDWFFTLARSRLARGCLAIFVWSFSEGTFAQIPATNRVSVDSSGVQGDKASGWDIFPGSMPSANGRFVAFHSDADNLVAGDTNGATDVFVHDRLRGTTERVSVDSSGAEANNWSRVYGISLDGRFVAFTSDARNLVPSDTNLALDVFLRDRWLGTTERVSVDSSGAEGNSASLGGMVSQDGRLVLFYSYADNLVTGDTNLVPDVFVRDLQSGTTERVSVSSSGGEGDSDSYPTDFSPDGRFVTFDSFADNLVTGDTNGYIDVFLHDRQSGTTEFVSVSSTGAQSVLDSYDGSISDDGRYVVFDSYGYNLVSGDNNNTIDVFLRDRQAGTTELVSLSSAGVQGNDRSGLSSLSSDHRWVAFLSDASNLVANDKNLKRDIFLRDLQTGTTTVVSVDSNGKLSNGQSDGSSISSDGRFVTFTSLAKNLVSGDSNGVYDVFIHGPSLTLEAEPQAPAAGATLEFRTWTGASTGANVLVATAVDGAPSFLPVVLGSFDAVGGWTFSATVPGGLSGHAVSFTTFGIVDSGKADRTNEFEVDFR